MIDRLLQRPEFADFWALKWADLLRVSRRAVQAKGAFALQDWLRSHLWANTPFDRVVRELLTARGSSATDPAANFYRIARDPQTLAETTALLFCGVRTLPPTAKPLNVIRGCPYVMPLAACGWSGRPG